MTGTITFIDRDGTSTDGQTFTTKSMTPVSGQFTLVVVTTASNATAAPTLSGTNGWNVTWTQAGTSYQPASGVGWITLFTGTPSSGTAGTLTADLGTGNSTTNWRIAAHQLIDIDSSSPIVQVVGAEDSGGDTTLTGGTMAAFATDSVVFLHAVQGAAGATLTAKASPAWSALGTVLSQTSYSRSYLDFWYAGEDTAPQCTSTTTQVASLLAVEFRAASAGSAAASGALAGEGGLTGNGLAGGSGLLARSMEKLGKLWQPSHKIIRPRLVVPVGVALQGV